jgi:hypothetical protein
MQLVAFGVIGQYVARIFEEAKQRPLYLVEESVEGGVTTAEDAPSTTTATPQS